MQHSYHKNEDDLFKHFGGHSIGKFSIYRLKTNLIKGFFEDVPSHTTFYIGYTGLTLQERLEWHIKKAKENESVLSLRNNIKMIYEKAMLKGFVESARYKLIVASLDEGIDIEIEALHEVSVKSDNIGTLREKLNMIDMGDKIFELERRYIFWALKNNYPLLNAEIRRHNMLRALIQHPEIDVLHEPFDSPVWKPVIIAYEEDNLNLNDHYSKEY